MASEINFYQCDETIVKSMAPLLLKVLEENKKAFIFTTNQARLKEIDDGLWSYGKNKFIPHVTISDKDFDLIRQPILISHKEENANKADYLVLTEDASDAFVAKFKRVFYFYNEANADDAKKLANKLQAIATQFNSYKKQEDGKWVKAAI